MLKIPYMLIALLPLVVVSLVSKKRVETKKHFLIVAITTFLFASMRGNGDGDYFNYLNAIHMMKGWSDVLNPVDYPFEFGFRVIAYLNNLLGFTPQFTIVILNLISMSVIFYLINKYSENRILSIFFYFPFLLMYEMHHSRSAVGMSFTVLLFFMLYERKIFKSFIVSFLALCFHKSSLLAIAIIYSYFICEKIVEKRRTKKLDRSTYSGVCMRIGMIAILLVIVQFIKTTDILVALTDFAGFKTLAWKMGVYLANERWSYPFSLLDPRFLLLLGLYLYNLLVLKDNNKFERNISDMIFVAIIVLIFLSDSTILTMRIYNYFNIYTIFFVPKMIQKIKKNQSKVYSRNVIMIIISVHLVYFLALSLKQVDYLLYFM